MGSTTNSRESMGFVGLGAMGMPMARHLANKLPAETRIHVFDVAQKAMEDLYAEFPSKVIICKNAKEVAQSTV